MLRIVNFEEIQRLLLEISRLVDMHDKKDAFFSARVKDWLQRTEKILENNQLGIASNLGALRAVLVSAEQGVVSDKIIINGRPTRKKILNATASFVLQKANETISEYLQGDMNRFKEAEQQTRQLVSYMFAKGMFQNFIGKPITTETLKNMWSVVRADPDLAPGTVNIEGLAGPNDSLIILNRIIAMDQRL